MELDKEKMDLSASVTVLFPVKIQVLLFSVKSFVYPFLVVVGLSLCGLKHTESGIIPTALIFIFALLQLSFV